MHRVFLAAPVWMLSVALSAEAHAPLPVVEDVKWEPFRDHCRRLLKTLDAAKVPLPVETVRGVQKLLDKKPDHPDAAIRAVQELVDPHCLLAVSINPESRVKAARGPAVLKLFRNQETVALIKIHNDGGITHRLRLRGPEIVRGDERDDGRWLHAVLVPDASSGAELSGRRLEYRLLRLTPRESGKREATFQFDVGQGTQDLGFRAEVPILFAIRRSTSP
jgi:hypothetical protein